MMNILFEDKKNKGPMLPIIIIKKLIAVSAFVFIVYIVVLTVIAYQNGAFALVEIIEKNNDSVYNFVRCMHEPTGTYNTYPEGTICGDGDEGEEKQEDEEE